MLQDFVLPNSTTQFSEIEKDYHRDKRRKTVVSLGHGDNVSYVYLDIQGTLQKLVFTLTSLRAWAKALRRDVGVTIEPCPGTFHLLGH